MHGYCAGADARQGAQRLFAVFCVSNQTEVKYYARVKRLDNLIDGSWVKGSTVQDAGLRNPVPFSD